MDKNLKICTIGGGSGMPIVNRALVLAGYEDISSIVTTFDSGGDSGRMRTDERGRIMAFSDYWRSIMSLWIDDEQKDGWEEMLKYRDGRGRNFGNIFFQFMEEKTGNLSSVQLLFSKLTGSRINGRVLPVCDTPANVIFKTRSGRTYQGEHLLDELRMSRDKIENIWLDSKVIANKDAISAIVESNLIIFCPGSMYGSVITNLLPEGMSRAIVKSRAKKILMTNIMTVSLENDGFNQVQYYQIFEKYLNCRQPFDLIVMPDLLKLNEDKMKQVLSYYQLENSYPLKYCSKTDIPTLVADVATIDEQNFRLRHSEKKLTKLMVNLIL